MGDNATLKETKCTVGAFQHIQTCETQDNNNTACLIPQRRKLDNVHSSNSAAACCRRTNVLPHLLSPQHFRLSLGLWDLGRRAPKHALQEPNCSTNDVLICSCDAFKITTLPVLDRPNSVQHLQARCRGDNYSLQLKRMIGTAKAVTSAHHFPTRQSSAYQATSISCHKRSIER